MIEGKKILITGVCGTIGARLAEELLNNKKHKIKSLIGLDHNENEIFFIDQKYSGDPRCDFFVTDVRDRNELVSKMRDVDVVFHLAAIKHVVHSERTPEQAIYTNIHGVQNIINAAKKNNVKIVIFSSSDKAVNPTNVMGTSKLMGERLITAANSGKGPLDTIFISTRFGNVLGSNGSVVPIFYNQISNEMKLTLTDVNMTRFIMSENDAVNLLISSSLQGKGGEVFVTKMPVIRIKDLAIAMIDELAPKFNKDPASMEIVEIGAKPGEKLYEELMSVEEVRRSVELDEFYSVLPAFRNAYSDISYTYKNIKSTIVDDPYISSEQTLLTVEEIKAFLNKNNLI